MAGELERKLLDEINLRLLAAIKKECDQLPQKLVNGALKKNIEVHSSPERKRTRNMENEEPAIPLLLEEELRAVPKYMKGRVTLERLNLYVQDLNTIFKNKYKQLFSKNKKEARIAQNKYQETESPETRGMFYITEQDIKEALPLKTLRIDATYRMLLTILRHLGRIKECRSPGLLRLALI